MGPGLKVRPTRHYGMITLEQFWASRSRCPSPRGTETERPCCFSSGSRRPRSSFSTSSVARITIGTRRIRLSYRRRPSSCPTGRRPRENRRRQRERGLRVRLRQRLAMRCKYIPRVCAVEEGVRRCKKPLAERPGWGHKTACATFPRAFLHC